MPSNRSYPRAIIHFDADIPLSDPREFLRLIEAYFDSVYIAGTLYRASSFGLYALTSEHAIMHDLFGESAGVQSQAKLMETMDSLTKKYGKHTLHLGMSLNAITHEKKREVERRKRSRMSISVEWKRNTINIPYLGVAR